MILLGAIFDIKVFWTAMTGPFVNRVSQDVSQGHNTLKKKAVYGMK
jgi:hypothetical protein